jgi:DNA-binding XRE family transcriptional regulator
MEKTCDFKSPLAEVIVNVSTNVRKYRREKNLTQQDLAWYSDCERATISNIERCNCDNLSIKILVKISLVLEISVVDLFVN